MLDSLHDSAAICKRFQELKLGMNFSYVHLKHLGEAVKAALTHGYRGKIVDIARHSNKSRTTISHFFNHSKWDKKQLQTILQEQVKKIIYTESQKTNKPIYCVVDDTIASHTKPSSQAEHPIEQAYWHQSHLTGHKDYGHQVVSVMLSCNGIVLNYAMELYDKSKSKIELVKKIAEALPVAPVKSYFLCDSWYTSKELMDSFIVKGFYTIGALRTNRLIYPNSVKQQVKEFALSIQKNDAKVHLVTVNKRKFWVYRYEGHMKTLENAAVLLCYPEQDFGKPSALRVFMSSDVSLTDKEILNYYTCRWDIEVFFRQSKNQLALDKCQLRTEQGIKCFWLILSFVHFLCCTATGKLCSFQEGFRAFQTQLLHEHYETVYRCAKFGVPLDDLLKKLL